MTRAIPAGRRRPPSESIPERGPGRVLYWASLVNAIGTGMYLISSAVFFVRYVGLPETQVGLGLSVGAVIGLASGIPAGHLADRYGARRVYVISLVAEALVMCSFTLVHSFWVFAAATTCASLAASASSAARGPVIQFASGANPARLKAQIRSVTNAGLFVGGAAAGVALDADNRGYYLVLILGNAASFAICAALMAGLPKVPASAAKESGKRSLALRDGGYLRVSAINFVMSLQYPILPFVLPLWIISRTSVPHWAIAVLIPLNTILVVLLQMRATRRMNGLRSAAGFLAGGGAVMFVSFLLMAAVPSVPDVLGIATLFAAVTINALGEIFWAAGSYELSFGLAPPEALGQYLGLYSTSGGLGRAVSQALVTFLCLSLGFPGWIVFGCLILVAAMAAPYTVKRVLAARPESATALETADLA